MGRHFARALGRDLSEANVAVVSGLARGIDGEAHAGVVEVQRRTAIAASPIGVVASGLDVVYPREHDWLWNSVAETGALISEYPPGTPPGVHRFPQRNRIIAALSEVLVVVESDVAGGSMHTVREAMVRGIDVMAVPGAPSIRTSSGTNALIADGCAPITSVDDIMTALGLCEGRSSSRVDVREVPRGLLAHVLNVVRHEPVTVETVSLRCNLPVIDTAVCLGQLRQMGWVDDSTGWWEALVARR
jgi:DNA processing protein